ncbi:hypothetical protein BGZ96_011589 [Linnemannia gamsii]|uniref:Uncharacterized protein n=1 Tax=Linnemannia gamsii TaxID=64522 RepID=A0ABQ7KCH6_9FUNG|nr:hypothetical protein BGZ96_011589 [Linnemannia gamsii]
MASRYTPSPLQGQQQQRYAPANQFHEGHTIPTESPDWNAYSDQSMKPSTASVSSIQSWVSTDPSSSNNNYGNQYSSQSQQQPSTAHYSSHQSYMPPPRGSSVTPSARNRSNSNNSTASGAGMGYGYGNGGGYTGSHLSHISQASNSSVYSQQQQYQQYQDLSTYQPSTSFNGAPNANESARPDQQYSQQGYSSYDTQHTNESALSLSNGASADNYTPNFQQPQPLYPHQHQQHQQRHHRSTPSDVSHVSVNRAIQQESLVSQSQSLMQSIEQVGPSQQGSPRMNHRSVPKRREHGQATAANMTPDGDLPSLDQYEAMLQKMASPTLGPSSPREARSNLRRTENDRENRAARQARKQQQHQHQQPMSMDQMLYSGDLAPPPPTVMIVQDSSPLDQSNLHGGGGGGHLRVTSAEERKLRRRSSLPSSLASSPSQLLTNLRRRNSGHHSPMDPSAPSATLQVHPLDNPFGSRQLDMGTHQNPSTTYQVYENSRRLLHVDEDDDDRSVISEDSERQRMDHLQRNRRNSSHLTQPGAKPPLTTKSQLRLSHTLSQTDVDEANMLASPGAKDGDLEVASVAALAAAATADAAESQKTDEGDRQIEQFQWELSQLQQGGSTPRNLASPKPSSATLSSSRSRATTPLGIVAEELLPMPTGPSRQQLLASMEDGGSKSGPNRTTSPISMMKSRPTTPVSGIRPPPGPAPPMMSAPILGNGAYHSPPPSVNGGPRKGTRDPTRRVKPSPPVSSNIMPPTTPRLRTGSIAMIDGMLTQAPPTLPLPSLPPPPPPSAGQRSSNASVASETATQRRRKPSGGRDLVQPSAQLLAEYTFGGQDSLPTPAPSLPMTPEIGSNGPSPSMLEKEKELVTAKDEIQRLQALLADQDKGAAAALEARQELETKLEAMMIKKLHEEGDDIHRAPSSNSTAEQEEQLVKMRQEQSVQQESNAALQQELEVFTERLQQEEAQYRTLQDTVQRLTLKISRLETQHAAEVQQIQQDHEEFLEKVVQDHAEKLTDLTEQSKADSEHLVLKFRQEQQEHQGHATAEKELAKEQATFRAREKVLIARLDEQVDRNQQLEERIFDLEKKQGEHDYEMDTWIKTNKSLERQMAIEQLKQQESRYQMDKVERENRRLRAILADLDLAALLGRAAADSEDDEDMEENREEAKSAYERQREKWIQQIQLLERKMAKAENEATAIMEKNMDLMVAIEMAHSS